MLLNYLTSSQLSEWEAYDRLDPIGEWREDFRIASISSLIINIVRSIYRKDEHEEVELTSPTDFMPIWDEELRKAKQEEAKKPKQSVEDMLSIMMGIANSINSKYQVDTTHLPFNKKEDGTSGQMVGDVKD